MANWEQVVEIFQSAFRDCRPPTECMQHMVVLIPKGNGEFRVIMLVEVLWKVLLVDINWRIGATLQFHDVLHIFRAGHGMGTASLKAKFLQHLMARREEILYEVFLDLRKAYDALDRERCMEILVGYGVGPRIERIIRHYWDHLSMMARAERYYRTLFKSNQGVTQGGTLSPTIFKMVADAVIFHKGRAVGGG